MVFNSLIGLCSNKMVVFHTKYTHWRLTFDFAHKMVQPEQFIRMTKNNDHMSLAVNERFIMLYRVQTLNSLCFDGAQPSDCIDCFRVRAVNRSHAIHTRRITLLSKYLWIVLYWHAYITTSQTLITKFMNRFKVLLSLVCIAST